MKISGHSVRERPGRPVKRPSPKFGGGTLLLATWLGFASGLAQASPLRGVDTDLTAASGRQTQFTFIGVDHDNWDLSALQSLDSQFATSVDPVELGAGVVTETLRQDSNLRQVVAVTTALSTVDGVTSSQAGETATASLQNAELGATTGQSVLSDTDGSRTELGPDGKRATASAQPTQPTAESPEVEDSALDAQPDSGGLSLRDALRSLVTKKRDYQNPTATAIAETASDLSETADDDFIDVDDRVLDSRTLGEALAAMVQPVVTAKGAQGFSVLGAGQFELETSSDVRDISISEASTGLSASMPLRTGLAPPPKEPQRIDLFVFAANFLATPTGTLASITFGIMFLVWAMTRVALAIRR
jgi:hypothetical protein